MSKTLAELVPDIHSILDRGLDHEPSDALAAKYAMNIGGALASATLPRNKPREKGKLWASDIGKDCDRKSWYEFNLEEEKAPLPGSASFKFLYGNILEEAVLYFAEEAGHTVEHVQARVEYQTFSSAGNNWTVSGRIDGIVDGTLVDVKSTSSYGYKKYTEEGLNEDNDSFGYRWQVSYYYNFAEFEQEAISSSDPGILWIDKQNGHIAATTIEPISKEDMIARITRKIDAIEQSYPPPQYYEPVPMGTSGNMKLPIECSYCDFKYACWPKVRTFIYSNGPVYLTTVKNPPRVIEVDKDGNSIC